MATFFCLLNIFHSCANTKNIGDKVFSKARYIIVHTLGKKKPTLEERGLTEIATRQWKNEGSIMCFWFYNETFLFKREDGGTLRSRVKAAFSSAWSQTLCILFHWELLGWGWLQLKVTGASRNRSHTSHPPCLLLPLSSVAELFL